MRATGLEREDGYRTVHVEPGTALPHELAEVSPHPGTRARLRHVSVMVAGDEHGRMVAQDRLKELSRSLELRVEGLGRQVSGDKDQVRLQAAHGRNRRHGRALAEIPPPTEQVKIGAGQQALAQELRETGPRLHV